MKRCPTCGVEKPREEFIRLEDEVRRQQAELAAARADWSRKT